MHRASSQHSWILRVNMLGVCLKTCAFLLCAAVYVEGAHLVPSLEFAKSYETHAQITIFPAEGSSKLAPSKTFMVEEYHDLEEKVGRIDFVNGSTRMQQFYYLETNAAATFDESESGLKCTKESINKFVEGRGFNGEMHMYHKPSGIIGPSAPLWMLNDTSPEPGEFVIRGIPCKKVAHLFFENSVPIEFNYYISSPNWTSVHNIMEEVPTRIEIVSNKTRKALYDFTFFEVNTSDSLYSSFLIPLHFGCADLMVTNNPKMRTMENQGIIYFTDEITDLFAEHKAGESIVELEKTWIDEQHHLVKFDTHDTDYIFASDILDFNTGVMYQTRKNKCTMMPIHNSPLFEKKFKGSTGQLKTVSEMLWLDLDYNYLGQTMHRGIHCNVFEAIAKDYKYGDYVFQRMVFTYFVMTPEYKTAANQETDQQYVVALVMTGYPDEKEEATMRVERDFFDFRHLNGNPDMNIENCLPESSKKYFSIYFPVKDEIRRLVEQERDEVLKTFKERVMAISSVSSLRLPYMKMYFHTENVIFVVRMLDAPPVQAGFSSKETTGIKDGQSGPTVKANSEECAIECEKSENCRGFTYCESTEGKNECYLTTDAVKEDATVATTKAGCTDYNRAVIDSNLSESRLEGAIASLKKAVKTFVIKVIDPKTKETKEIKASRMEADISPFNAKKNYEQLYDGRRLVKDSRTILEVEVDVVSESECFDWCLKNVNLTCTSFSYCPIERRCYISERTLVNLSVERLNEASAIATNCKIFRRNAPDIYSESLGLVSSSRGDKTYEINVPGSDQCAIKCMNEKEFHCEGFEACPTQCILHKKHILDVVTIPSADASCKHFYLNYSLTMLNMGNDIVTNPKDIHRGMTLEECAKECFLPSSCRSINYCPAAPDKVPSTCELNDETVTGGNIVFSGSCINYEKSDADQDPKDDRKSTTTPTPSTVSDSVDGTTTSSTASGSSDLTTSSITVSGTSEGTTETTVRKKHVTQGVSQGTFTGAVIGMLIFGLAVGALGFVIYSYYRSRRADSGISVRFTNQSS